MDLHYRQRAADAAGAQGLELYRQVLGGQSPSRSHEARKLTTTERLLLDLGMLLSGPPAAFPSPFLARLTARFSEDELQALTEFAAEVLTMNLLTRVTSRSRSQERHRSRIARPNRPARRFREPGASSLPGVSRFPGSPSDSTL